MKPDLMANQPTPLDVTLSDKYFGKPMVNKPLKRALFPAGVPQWSGLVD